MLVLSLKTTESVHVDGPCEIIVTEAARGRVRLAFRAPDSTRILRDVVVTRDALAITVPSPKGSE